MRPRLREQSGAVEVNFGKRQPFTIGVEEEFQLVDETSGELVSRFDEIEEEIGHDVVKPELLQSVLEVATHVHTTVPEAIEESRSLRGRVLEAAAEGGTLVVSAGTHPFSRYENQQVTEQERELRAKRERDEAEARAGAQGLSGR